MQKAAAADDFTTHAHRSHLLKVQEFSRACDGGQLAYRQHGVLFAGKTVLFFGSNG
jgi:hypothetical protein